MKISASLMALCCCLAVVACAGPSTAVFRAEDNPSWIFQPCQDRSSTYMDQYEIGVDDLCVVGIARYPAAGGLDVCRNLAYQDAMSELSSTIKTSVISEFLDYASHHSGSRRSQTIQKLAEELETSTAQIFRGMVARGPEWISEQGYCFVLIGTRRHDLQDIVFGGVDPDRFADLAAEVTQTLNTVNHHGADLIP